MHVKDVATDIVKKLVHSGYKAYFAGGWVRDYLMGHPSDDIDIATDAPPQVILDLFPHTILVGLAFGVVIVVSGGHQFEVSTFRKDIEYLNGRKPESIELSSAEEDAVRRDFTINGMFYDPLEDKIYDYVQGMADLKKETIRTIGDPFERFFEDRLRMIRAIRFSARFGFLIDLDTQQAIIENAETLFPAVAMERIWNEFVKMSKYPRFDHALIEMHRLRLLQVIFPRLKNTHLNDIKHYIKVFPDLPKNTPTILYITELFPNYTSQELWDLCLYLRTSTKEAKLVRFIHDGRKFLASNNPIEDKQWVHFYAEPYAELCLGIFAAHLPPEEKQGFISKHSRNQERLKAHIQRLRDNRPLVNANLLKELGIPQGKQIGFLLDKAEEITIKNNFQDAEAVLNILRQSSFWPKS